MGFDLTRFRRTRFEPRQIRVEVPELADWFGDAEPVFVVVNLDGEKMYAVRDAVNKRADFEAVAGRLLSGAGEAIGQALDDYFGAVPEEYARQIEMIYHGVVEPEFTREDAVKFVRHFPVAANKIVYEIARATGEGSQPGESKGSGGTPASATTST